MSARDAARLVKIADAPDICPALMCPKGTRIYQKNGVLDGIVVESSSKMVFSGGRVAPGFTTWRPGTIGPQTLIEITSATGEYSYVIPDEAPKKETP